MTSSTNNNNKDSLLGAFNVLADNINKAMQNKLPVKVTKVSDDRKFVNVQPLIMLVDSNGDAHTRAEVKGIPVETIGAGNFLISFNVSVDDLGWIKASDRDISLFIQSYKESKPNTARMHSFSDATFSPDIMTDFTINEDDADSMVIQNRDGSTRIAISDTKIKLVQGGIDIELKGDAVTGVAPNGFDLNGFTIDSSGAAESPVSLTSPSVIADGKELAGHDHSPGTFMDAEARPITGVSGANN